MSSNERLDSFAITIKSGHIKQHMAFSGIGVSLVDQIVDHLDHFIDVICGVKVRCLASSPQGFLSLHCKHRRIQMSTL